LVSKLQLAFKNQLILSQMDLPKWMNEIVPDVESLLETYMNEFI